PRLRRAERREHRAEREEAAEHRPLRGEAHRDARDVHVLRREEPPEARGRLLEERLPPDGREALERLRERREDDEEDGEDRREKEREAGGDGERRRAHERTVLTRAPRPV